MKPLTLSNILVELNKAVNIIYKGEGRINKAKKFITDSIEYLDDVIYQYRVYDDHDVDCMAFPIMTVRYNLRELVECKFNDKLLLKKSDRTIEDLYWDFKNLRASIHNQLTLCSREVSANLKSRNPTFVGRYTEACLQPTYGKAIKIIAMLESETDELFDDRWFAPLFDRKYKF